MPNTISTPNLTTVLLEFPISVVKWANLASLQPTGDTMKMESVVTNSPGYSALLTCGRSLVCLTFDAKIHNVISADSAVINNNVPCPQSYRVPLLHLEALFAFRTFTTPCLLKTVLLSCSWWGICHFYVCHGDGNIWSVGGYLNYWCWRGT